VLHDLAAREDFPSYVFDKKVSARLFPGHPFGTPADGTVESVSGLTIQNVRQAHETYFAPNKMLLVVVGNVTLENARSLIEQKLGGLPEDDLPGLRPPPMPKLDGVVRETINRRVAQAQLFLGTRMDGIDVRGEYVLNVLDTVLGHGMNSRLFTQIRENRGYVYDVHVEGTVYPDILVWGVEAGTEQKRLDEVEKLVRRELDKLAREVVTDRELEVAGKYLEASIRRSTEINDGLAAHIGATVIRGRPLLGVEERVELVRSVSKEEVRELAAKLFGSGHLHVFVMK
jgi:zinc protease